MHTILELIEHMTQSSIQGVIGVTGIVVFLCSIVAAACYRIKELQKHDQH